MEENLTTMRKFVAPEFIFGTGARNKCADYVRTFGGGKVLLVSDKGVGKAGWTRSIEKTLRESGIDYVLYDSVTPNPRDSEVMEGAECYRHNKCDMLMVAGGGSPMDCAKGIGIVVSNSRNILSFEGVDNVPIPMPPLICIPTTAGTSADVSQFAIILDTEHSNKIAIISKSVVPDISLIDPETTVSMDPELTAETGLDALTHAVESFVSNAASPVTEMHALGAIEYLRRYLPRAVREPDNEVVRAGVMMGSLLAGMSFSNASLGLVHSMAHALGGLLDLPHGLCNALLLEHVAEFNFFAEPVKYRRIAEVLTGRNLESESEKSVCSFLGESLREFRTALSVKGPLDTGGMKADVIETLARQALNDACTVTNPRSAETGDIAALYRKVFSEH